jgi:predicted nucleic acid-binding protein
MHKGVLLDTSFFIRFLNESDPLFKNSEGYYKYFIQKEIPMFMSTISIAEYCVLGTINELPLKDLQIIPFNLSHSKRTGEFARIVFNKKGKLKLQQRNIIPNDTKLFSQADVESNIGYYLSSDTESKKVYDLLVNEEKPKFQFIDLSNKYSEVFGVLEL